MNKLLAIVGPTATGKTARAIAEAKKTPSIIVSADSRQVYRGMDIVTGKDHPKDMKIFGIDIVNPDESCSVALWYNAVIPHIKKAWAVGKQVIVVGGTGLYVRALTGGIETMVVPPNKILRNEMSTLSLTELQDKLKTSNPAKFSAMNHSDQCNPRRLIRAIEIGSDLNKARIFGEQVSNLKNSEVQIIGLRCIDDSNHRYKIMARVRDRLKMGAVKETQSLLAKYDKSLPSMSAIGYRSIIKFIAGEFTKSAMIDAWVHDELSYAKRQLTWFRKQPVIWYDIGINKV